MIFKKATIFSSSFSRLSLSYKPQGNTATIDDYVYMIATNATPIALTAREIETVS